MISTYLYEKKSMSLLLRTAPTIGRIRFVHPIFSGFRSSAADLCIMRKSFIVIRNLVKTAFCLIYNKQVPMSKYDDILYAFRYLSLTLRKHFITFVVLKLGTDAHNHIFMYSIYYYFRIYYILGLLTR